jgi:hypothetical protein
VGDGGVLERAVPAALHIFEEMTVAEFLDWTRPTLDR